MSELELIRLKCQEYFQESISMANLILKKAQIDVLNLTFIGYIDIFIVKHFFSVHSTLH